MKYCIVYEMDGMRYAALGERGQLIDDIFDDKLQAEIVALYEMASLKSYLKYLEQRPPNGKYIVAPIPWIEVYGMNPDENQ